MYQAALKSTGQRHTRWRILLFLIFFLAFFSVLFLISIPTYGQSYQTFSKELEQIAEQAKYRLGPFRIYPTIWFKDIGYDDNVYGKREEDGPISDYTMTISPEAKVYLLFRNYLILTLTESPEYVFYIKQKRERRLNNNITPEFKLLLFNRFVISGDYYFSNRRWRATSEFDVRANQHMERFRGRFFYESARRTSLGISLSLTKISFEDIISPGEEIHLSRALGRDEMKSYFEFNYKIFSESFFFLNGEYAEYEFSHIESQWRNSYSYQVNSGLRFPFIGRIKGTFSLGYKRLIPVRAGKTGFSGLVGDTNLLLKIRRFNFRFSYIRDCRFSYFTDNIFFLESRYGTGISYYLTKYIRLDYDFWYGIANYPELILLRMPDETYNEIERRDIYRTHSVGFVVRIIRNTGLGMRANFWERNSNLSGIKRDRIFVGGYLTYEF